eukprot:1161213-Pelagomonas_calceolata.AAC.5
MHPRARRHRHTCTHTYTHKYKYTSTGPPRAPNISTIFQNNNTASLEAFEEFLESENAQQFEDNEDFRRTREFFRNNNITAFANNETAQVRFVQVNKVAVVWILARKGSCKSFAYKVPMQVSVATLPTVRTAMAHL